jgi:hypothetical protein
MYILKPKNKLILILFCLLILSCKNKKAEHRIPEVSVLINPANRVGSFYRFFRLNSNAWEEYKNTVKIYSNAKKDYSPAILLREYGKFSGGISYSGITANMNLPYRYKDICLLHNQIMHKEKIENIYGLYSSGYLGQEYDKYKLKYFPNCNDSEYYGCISFSDYEVKYVCNKCNKLRDEYKVLYVGKYY